MSSISISLKPWLLCIFMEIANSASFLTTVYGADSSQYQSSMIDQGRISLIEWGTSTINGALVVSSWSSDGQTSDELTLGTDSGTTMTACNPATLSHNDYFIGYKVYYDDYYVFGMELYSLTGDTFFCYDTETIADKSSAIMSPDTHYKNNSDFYFLSGWVVHDHTKINGIQLQFTNIGNSQPSIEFLPESSFSASSEFTLAGITALLLGVDDFDQSADKARYSSFGWSPDLVINDTDSWLKIDLLRPMKISAIGTKGCVLLTEWTTKYEFAWSVNEDESVVNWRSFALDGNNDTNTEVLHSFIDDPIIAQYLMFYPLEWPMGFWPALRVEAYGHEIVTAVYQPITIQTTDERTTTSAVTAGISGQLPSFSDVIIISIASLAALVIMCMFALCTFCIYHAQKGRARGKQSVAQQIAIVQMAQQDEKKNADENIVEVGEDDDVESECEMKMDEPSIDRDVQEMASRVTAHEGILRVQSQLDFVQSPGKDLEVVIEAEDDGFTGKGYEDAIVTDMGTRGAVNPPPAQYHYRQDTKEYHAQLHGGNVYGMNTGGMHKFMRSDEFVISGDDEENVMKNSGQYQYTGALGFTENVTEIAVHHEIEQ